MREDLKDENGEIIYGYPDEHPYYDDEPLDPIAPATPTGGGETPAEYTNPGLLGPTPDGTTSGPTNPGTQPWSGSFTPPQRQAYPDLPIVANAPQPNLPQWRQAPAFTYADYEAPKPFTSPSVDQMLVDPSYNWRKAQGEESLQRWAAARGTLNDSGTAKSLLEYGGNAASQEYSNIWNRDYNAYNTNEGNRAQTYDRNRRGAVDTYNTNYQTQYVDPYKAAYTSAIDTWIPQQETWRAQNNRADLGYTVQTGLVQHDNDMNYQNQWDQFLNGRRMWENDRDFGLRIATA